MDEDLALKLAGDDPQAARGVSLDVCTPDGRWCGTARSRRGDEHRHLLLAYQRDHLESVVTHKPPRVDWQRIRLPVQRYLKGRQQTLATDRRDRLIIWEVRIL